MWKLTFLLKDIGTYPTFEKAFEELKNCWKMEKNKSLQSIDTIWITNPDNKPLFYKQICELADSQNLP